MRTLILLICLASVITLTACATPEERALAALEQQLGLEKSPYFPRCLSQEVAPKAALRKGDHSVVHTVYNPQGNVPIDECARWETEEPVGELREPPPRLVLKKRKKTNILIDDVTDP